MTSSVRPARVEQRRVRDIVGRLLRRYPALLGSDDPVQHFDDFAFAVHARHGRLEKPGPDRMSYEIVELGEPAQVHSIVGRPEIPGALMYEDCHMLCT